MDTPPVPESTLLLPNNNNAPDNNKTNENKNNENTNENTTTSSTAPSSTTPPTPTIITTAATTTAATLSDKDNDNDSDVAKEYKPAAASSTSRARSTASRFKMQSRPAQLIRNLHASYFTPPSSSTECPSSSSPEATAVGKAIQSIRRNLFAFGAIVSVAGCAILIGHERAGLYLHGIGHSGLLAQVAYQGLFAVACSWQWLKPLWPSKRMSHLSATRSDDTSSSPLDSKPSEPANASDQSPTVDNSGAATLEEPSSSVTSTSPPNTASSLISMPSFSSLPYWILGYGLLGLFGLTPALSAHGWRSLVWNPAIILSTLTPLLIAPALLGLDRISAALSKDTERHNADLDELQERHEIMMEAYRDENLLKKNILLETVGKEVQDAATLAIETLRQMTPTSLFPPSVSREQLSPCTLPIPITSILGLFTTMRHLQYISRNMQRLSRVMFTEYVQGIVEKTSPHYHRGESGFDVGEFVQSLGDLVSADASLKGVEFVIYHSEYGLSHVPIKGSEESWRHALINLIKSIIDSAKSGSTVELCLVLFALPQREVEKNKVMVTFEITYYPNPNSTSNEDDLAQLNALLASKLVKAMGGTLEIQQLEDFTKKFIVSVEVELNQNALSQDERSVASTSSTTATPATKSGQDSPSAVHPLDATTKPDDPLQPIPIQGHLQRLENMQTKYPLHESQQFFQQHLKTPLVSPSPSPSSPPSKRGSGSPKTSTEPTVSELAWFSRKLGGVKVVLMAREHSAFGVRLLGYLKTWGIHVTTKTIRDADSTEGEGETGSIFTTEDPLTPTGAAKRTNSSSSLSGKTSDLSGKAESAASKSVSNPAFIMIDDDVKVLGQQILKLQSNPPSPGPGSTAPKGRPTHRRHKSINSIQHTSIIYFTSLPTFKQARDTIMLILGTQMPGMHYSVANTLAGYPPNQGPLPYILVLPKPAGPRRVLTAIHTAINVPVMDQTYSPIATAPTSPAPLVRHFSAEINPFDRDRIVYDPVSHQAYAQTIPYSTQSSPGSSSPNHSLPSDQRLRRDVRHYADPRGSGGMMTYPSESSLLGGVLSPETPGGSKFSGTPNGMPVPAFGNQPQGILFDPTASRSQGTLSPSPGGPGQRRISNGGGRYSSHASEGNAYVIPPPNTGTVQHQPFSAMHAQRTADVATPMAQTSSPDPTPSTGIQPIVPPIGYIRFSNGQVLRPGTTRSPLATPFTITQSPGILFSPPTTRHSGMSSPLPQRATDPLTPRNENGGGTRNIIGVDSPKGSHPVLHGLPSPLAISAAGTILRNSPGTTSGSVSSLGTSPLPTTPEVTANRNRSGLNPVRKTKDSGAKASPSLVKSGVVERVSPLVNVLIVEDNKINQSILMKFMQRRKIKFDVACNGKEAVDKWRVGGFHLVLMDIQMPVMDGIEATREIRQMEKAQRIGVFPTDKPNSIGNTMSLMAASSASSSGTGASTPSSPFRSPVIIVALTASAESEESRNTALLAGCNDYITKPIDLPWLERKIVEWGCMQALIDVDAWKEWKRDLDGASPGSPSAGPSRGGTVGASAALKQSLSGPGKLTQASLRRPSSTRWTKGNKAAAAAAAAAVAAKNAVAGAEAAAGLGPDTTPLKATAAAVVPPSPALTATATTTTATPADDAIVPGSKSSPGISDDSQRDDKNGSE